MVTMTLTVLVWQSVITLPYQCNTHHPETGHIGTFLCSCDLDFDQMTLIYELHHKILNNALVEVEIVGLVGISIRLLDHLF